jgi:hypothetical protein
VKDNAPSFPFYELATLTVPVGTIPDAVKDIGGSPNTAGKLIGCWASDIGTLNNIFVLRGFQSFEGLLAEREQTLRSGKSFYGMNYLERLTLDTYLPFPGLSAAGPGKMGDIYEIRTYELKTGGLAPTLDAWADLLPHRRKFSELVIALYSIDGPPRIAHIWPYKDLGERSRIRAEAVESGHWPPRCTDWLTSDMQSVIAMPTAISPLS